MEGVSEHRHVVDAAGDDQRRRHPFGQRRGQLAELRVDAQCRGVRIGPDLVADDDHPPRGLGRGVDVLGTGDLEERLLERGDEPLLDLRRGRARHLDEDVDHRHLDLRLLFARRDHHREGAEEERGDDEQRRQLRIEERLRHPPRDAERLAGHLEAQRLAPGPLRQARRPLLARRHDRFPSRIAPAGGAAARPSATSSPPARPASTSMRPSASRSPRLTARVWARPSASRTTTRVRPPA